MMMEFSVLACTCERVRMCVPPRALMVFSQLYLISGVSSCIALGGAQCKEEASADESLLKEQTGRALGLS